MESFYDRSQMDEVLVTPSPFEEDYEEILEQGGPDIGFVYGAPNEYEGRIRFKGAQSDVLHNHHFSGNVPDVLIVPEGEQDAVRDLDIELLEQSGGEVQEPDMKLYTTADDIKSALDLASDGDVVHGFTSDYHGLKCHLAGDTAFSFMGDNEYRTFAFETERGRRENAWKHNFLAQSVDTPRQIYELAKDAGDY